MKREREREEKEIKLVYVIHHQQMLLQQKRLHVVYMFVLQ